MKAQFSSLEEASGQQIKWTPSKFDPDVRQAYISVPVDYSDLSGAWFEVAVSRRPASLPSERVGALVALNGGPGGTESLGIVAPVRFEGRPLIDHFDIIGIDLRGFGESQQLLRADFRRKARFTSRPTHTDVMDVAEDMRTAERLGADNESALRKHCTTKNVARDIDLIRRCLEEEHLNMIGYAYGTYVVAVYGAMFPSSVRRTVLDATVHPDWIWREQFERQADAMRKNYESWAQWAARRPSRIGLGSTSQNVLDNVERLYNQVEHSPLHGLNGTILDLACGCASTMRDNWLVFADALRTVLFGNEEKKRGAANVLLQFASSGMRGGTFPSYDSRAAAAREAVLERGHIPEGMTANVLEVTTSEVEWEKDVADYARGALRRSADTPQGLGALRAMPWVSVFSEPPAEPPLIDLDWVDIPQGLVVQNEGDPLDPYEAGPAMASRIGHYLITIADDGGHEMYPQGGHEDLNSLVEKYLIHGDLPETDLSLSGRQRPDVPVG